LDTFWAEDNIRRCDYQVQFYQMKAASADTASSLRDWVKAAFQTMNEIDLNAIGGSSDKLVDEPRAN